MALATRKKAVGLNNSGGGGCYPIVLVMYYIIWELEAIAHNK
jgi:hypothetical protein